MSLSSIELQRARRQLRAYCEQRGRSPGPEGEWSVQEDGGCFEVSVKKLPVFRLRFEEGAWYLYVPGANGIWMAYPPRPQADSFAVVMAELEQAPLHVHW